MALYGIEDELNLKLMVTLTRCLQSINKKEFLVIQGHGLTPAQFGVLETLFHKGSMPICEIIRKTLSTGGNMTVVIDNLVKSGMVERKPDAQDRRSIIISLSEAGQKIIQTAFSSHVENLKSIMGILTAEEKETMIHLSRKLGKNE